MKKINLLSEKYSRKAAFHREISQTASVTGVVFLFWILFVTAAITTERVVEAVVLRNQTILQSEEMAEAEQMSRLAARAKTDSTYYSMLGTAGGVQPEILLTAMNQIGNVEAREISADAAQSIVTISGQVTDKDELSGLMARLKSVFAEVKLPELTLQADGGLYFTTLIQLGDLP